MKTKQLALAVIGTGLLAGLVVWIGPRVLWEQFYALRWMLPFLVLLGLGKHALRTWAWRRALLVEGVALNFPCLFRVRLASQSMAYLSGMDGLVSEPLKPWLLRRTIAIEKTIPATLVENSVYWFTSLAVTTTGALVAIHMLADHHSSWTLSVLCLMAFSAVVALLFARSPLLPKMGTLARSWKPLPPKWESVLVKAVEMERQMRSFRLRHPAAMAAILGIDLLVQALMVAEVWIVLSGVGIPLLFSQLMAIEAAGRLVKMMSFSVPGRLGVDEAGGTGSFLLLGLSPAAGLTLAMARRIQALSWVVLGVAWFMRGEAASSVMERGGCIDGSTHFVAQNG